MILDEFLTSRIALPEQILMILVLQRCLSFTLRIRIPQRGRKPKEGSDVSSRQLISGADILLIGP